ncbi:Uncharacterized protein TPAR_06902 [Tolypocladium paradoxum]|uniref:Kinesin light chain n=1 Tax=Tolypocladium paradoxum TaxID=94208 RepID=A0A2S4KRT6_9HYPO|nr:Uncharacterized protein TPAR_06902 [Tolypocladium paradoxum]
MGNLARVLRRQGKYEEAEATHRETLALCRQVLGDTHPNTLTSMSSLARVLNNQGKHEEAEVLDKDATT